MSNTSKGRGEKGSKLWVQILVNHNNGIELAKEIQKRDSSIGNITWVSPIEKDEYKEYKLNSGEETITKLIEKNDTKFWPAGQPWWDAIGVVERDHGVEKTIILVEGKSYPNEMRTNSKATDINSTKLIVKALRETYEKLTQNNIQRDKFSEEIWMQKYYQLGNRLAFLYKLREKGYDIKLILLNIVNDPTHTKNKQISEQQWKEYYENVFNEMLGDNKIPKEVIILNVEVSMKWN